MNKISAFLLFLFCTLCSHGQDTYKDSLNQYIANYIKNHEVVAGKDKQLLQFYPVSEKYKVIAQFEKKEDSKWFDMETSGPVKQTYRVYGIVHFTIDDQPAKLNIYQSQNLMAVSEYKNYLFIPFTDLSSGEETYEAGRYIDLNVHEIIDNNVILDFNKAYNPYCAYVSGKYNCPIPPKENYLAIAIHAGEKKFKATH